MPAAPERVIIIPRDGQTARTDGGGGCKGLAARFFLDTCPALAYKPAILFIVDDLDGRPGRPVCA